MLSTRVRAVRAETSWERGGWGGWAGRGETDASSKRRGFRHPKLHAQHGPRRPRAPAVVARGTYQSSNDVIVPEGPAGRGTSACLVRGSVSPAILSTYFYRTAGKRVKANRIDRSGRRAGHIAISEPSYVLVRARQRSGLVRSRPRGYAQRPRRRPHCPYSHTTYVPFLRTTPSPMRDATCLPGYRVKDRSQCESLNFSALSPTCPRRLHHFMSVNTCAAGALASEHCPHTPT